MEQIYFTAKYSSNIGYKGTPIYIEREQSLNYVPFNNSVDFSIMLGSSYIGLDVSSIDGFVSHLSGLTPRHLWIPFELSLPRALPGKLYVCGNTLTPPGGAISYSGNWKTYFCASQNYMCIRDINENNKCSHVEFAGGLIAGISNCRLSELWIVF